MLGMYADFSPSIPSEWASSSAEIVVVDAVRESVLVGALIKAKWKGHGSYYSGKIVSAHGDGTFDIDYDDSDKYSSEKHVERGNIQVVFDRNRPPQLIENAAAIEGKIALIERSAIREAGMRNWVEPVKQAHAAGAVGVIFVNTDDELVEHAMEATGLVKALDARVVFRRTVDGKDEDGAFMSRLPSFCVVVDDESVCPLRAAAVTRACWLRGRRRIFPTQ